MLKRLCPNRVTFIWTVLLAACLAAASPAHGAVIYDFSLPANGDVGPIAIQLTLPDFLPANGLNAFATTDPEATVFSSVTPIEPTSVVGVDIDPGVTLFGLALFSPGGNFTLLNRDYPADFFNFVRTPTETGTFLSSSGLVESDFSLDTTTPTATLTVTATPEPVTVLLFGIGAAGMAARRRWQHSS
jgi:hypothetical protein